MLRGRSLRERAHNLAKSSPNPHQTHVRGAKSDKLKDLKENVVRFILCATGSASAESLIPVA